MGASQPGVLALLGGASWSGPVRDVLGSSVLREREGRKAVVLPTAAAYEHPERAAGAALDALADLGFEATVLPVLRRPDAAATVHVEAVRKAAVVAIVDGSALHLRAVLKDTPVFGALLEAHRGGTALVAAGAGSGVLCDPMLDPRGGAYTVGLGLVRDITVFPHFDAAPEHLRERSTDLLPPGVVLAGVDGGAALVRDRAGGWRAAGAGAVTVYETAGGEARRFQDEDVVVLSA
jgi:cyanophycinase